MRKASAKRTRPARHRRAAAADEERRDELPLVDEATERRRRLEQMRAMAAEVGAPSLVWPPPRRD